MQHLLAKAMGRVRARNMETMTPEEIAEDIAFRLLGHPECVIAGCERPACHEHTFLCRGHFEEEKRAHSRRRDRRRRERRLGKRVWW